MDSKKNEMELNIVYQTCPNGLGQKVTKDGLKTPVWCQKMQIWAKLSQAGRGSEVNGELVLGLGLGKMHCLLALQSKLLYLSKKHTFRAKSKCKELIISKWHFFTVKLSDYSVSNIFVLEIKWVFF